MTRAKVVICPYCGETQSASERCRSCGGLFEPLSRQATHNAMGPWYVRDGGKPFQPGCSYETLVRMIDRGQVTKYSILRGPTTKQFWTVAKHVPGVAHLLGYCHNCDASVDPGDHGCHVCGETFGAYLDRNYLGLPDIRPLPWEADLDHGGRAGMSTFASDEELRLHGPVHLPSAAAVAEPRVEMHAETSTSVFEGQPASPVGRSLRRKLAHQQRLINFLIAAVAIITVLSVVTNLDELSALFGGGGTTVQAPQKVEPVRAAPPPAVEADELPPPAEPLPAEPPQTDPVQQPSPATEPAPDPAPPAAQPGGDATALINAAEQPGRPIDDRIADYEKALAILRGSGGAEATIAAAETALEKLRLKRDWFGDGN